MGDSHGDGDIRLDRTLDACRGHTQKSRLDGMKDLKAFFDRRHKASNVDNLSDKSYHKIYEVTFLMALAEIQVFSTASKNTKSAARARLDTCGEVVRTVIKAGAHKLKGKTIEAVVKHITQTLPRAVGRYHEPLAKHYLTALSILFEYQPNVEHLKIDVWTEAADFCLRGINAYLDKHDGETGLSRSLSGLGTSHPSSSLAKSIHTPSHEGMLTRQNAEDLFQTLCLLVSAPNAPLIASTEDSPDGRYVEVTETTIRFLRLQSSSASQAHQLAFSILNVVICITRQDRILFTQSTAQDILPVICRFWQGKAVAKDEMLNSVRDEILILLFSVHLHLEHALKDEDSSDLLPNLEALLEAFKADYARRSDRDQLQLDDIRMADFGKRTHETEPFSLFAFQLRPHNIRAERNWAILRNVGILERLVSIGQQRTKPAAENEEAVEQPPRKRQRVDLASGRRLELLRANDESLRLAGLQIVPFVLQELQLSVYKLSELLTLLHVCAGDKRGNISSWALLAIASCASQSTFTDISSSERMQFWQLGVRFLTFSATCRAAALQLHAMIAKKLVQYREIGEDVGAMATSADISGPAVLCDSSISLMADVLHCRVTEVPSASLTTAQHIIRWMFARWSPDDQNFAARHSVHVQPHHVVSLIRTCLGLPRVSLPSVAIMPCGLLAQAWQRHLNTQEVVRYLLLLDDRPLAPTPWSCPSCPTYSEPANVNYVLTTSHFQAARKLVLELLHSKFGNILRSWNSYLVDRTAAVSADIFRSAVYSCITTSILISHFASMTVAQVRGLEAELSEFSKQLMSFFADTEAKDPKGSQSLHEVLLQAIHPYLPPCDSSEFSHLSEKAPRLLELFILIADNLSQRHVPSEEDASVQADTDTMDIDDDFPTVNAYIKSEAQNENYMPRLDLALELWSGSFYLVVSGQLVLVSAMSSTPDSVGFVPSSFIDYLVSMDEEKVLASRRLLQHVLASDLVMDGTDVQRIVECLGSIIQLHAYDRCEVALGMCLDVLIGLGTLWTGASGSESEEMAGQLYTWFIGTALEKELASPAVQKGIARLLLFLLRVNGDFRPPPSSKSEMPSVRSSLFHLLNKGNTSVRFYIGNQISQIFDLFILKDHDGVFEDVLITLPFDPERMEGISFRLFVLAQLASKWPTLLRRCIYYIFEAPGRMTNCTEHATRCLQRVASALKVEVPRDLFALFAPQLLYTWLDQAKIEDIPYSIFGFASLKDLVEHAQEEATALMIMRGQDESVEQVATILGVDHRVLLQKCFTKIMAYTIPHDMSKVPPASSGKPRVTGEARVRKTLGTEVFSKCIYLHFVDIVAMMFHIIDSEAGILKHLRKIDDLHYAADIMDEMKRLGSSDAVLPPDQQPTFRARYLCAEIQHLCSRTDYEFSNIYTPALVVSIARTLLNFIQPALGSLHACSVLRKIRILIALAGKTAVSGYPLEMFLHAMRPFLNDPECANDAIGITQYLLSAGSKDLLHKPTFVAGISLSLLGSLRGFFESQKASTTQESQHQGTKMLAQEFHAWLGQYLDSYQSPDLKSQWEAQFRKLFESAFRTQGVGNADVDTAESDLLFRLLDDEQQGGALLNRPSRELALTMLSSNFRGPDSFRTDILGTDGHCIDYAAVVWKSCHSTASKEYLCWAARVMGRAFAASGEIHGELLQESTLAQITELLISSDEEGGSRSCILSLLSELTLAQSPHTVGLAETALRVITSSSDGNLGISFQRSLGEALCQASSWTPYLLPPSETISIKDAEVSLREALMAEAISSENWLRDLSVALAQSELDEPLLYALVPILYRVPGFADRIFPFILHLVLSTSSQNQRTRKKDLSLAFMRWFEGSEGSETIYKNNLKMLLNSVLYLRTQPFPDEKSSADRSRWLDIDYLKAGIAATHCGMFKTSLLFTEEYCTTPARSTRRSSAVKEASDHAEVPTELLLKIFEHIDDPDMYYGVEQKANLSTILARFEYENDGPKSLAFRGAKYDSHVRNHDPEAAQDVQSLVKSLDILNQSGLSSSLLQIQQTVGMSSTALESMFRTARKLEQWDIPVPATSSNDSVTLYKAFQTIHMAVSGEEVSRAIDEGLERTMKRLVREDLSAVELHSSLQTLSALVELDEVLTSRGSLQFEEILAKFQDRSTWMKIGSFDDVSQILSCRSTTLGSLGKRPKLQEIMSLQSIDIRLVEVQTALLSSTINRAHSALQESLSLATSMMDLIGPCHDVGVNPEVAIHVEAANALWDQGEMSSSIGMLQALDDVQSLKKQTIAVGRSDLLTKIGYRVSVARLEKADRVIDKYLRPALKELKGRTEGDEAGQVFHQFAVFCDQQLQDPDSIEDLERLQRLSKNKADEVKAYEKLLTGAPSGPEKEKNKRGYVKAKTWLKLDLEELNRHNANRDEFLRQCLENYLLALVACDSHDSNALRFTALWLGHSEEQLANEAVSKHLKQVPSRKFAPLMNQLTSRLQDSPVKFHELLFSLVVQICTDHPFHGMYQIYASSVSRISNDDDSAVSRKKAAARVAASLHKSDQVGGVWTSLLSVNRLYTALAGDKDEKYKSGKKLALKDCTAAIRLNSALGKNPLPPNTMQIALSPSLDYSKLPVVSRLESQMTIASGVSAPKIITAVASNGARFKQLVKGGNDDLRQDAIMEQVFEQVSELLKSNRSTRQRNLSIRTYRVLPLSNIAGVIEFVPDTIPLHEYLTPAHERYYPKDLKANQCRKEIGDVQSQSVEARLKKFRQVTDKFHPVMRYFFTEKFTNPDEWFVRRLAYTRSTAAISILGHVLGLGDRHGHNILLDAKNGEVVHIDLGVAFEMGRVLPVPELVPFRLTRDIVDGMGITKTEGVFRRCCEFTLEALRKEVHTIMAILDVLRYDPLYSWSISPLKLAKMQDEQSAAPAANLGNERTKQSVNEPGEADRALTVVNKKLSKTLSATATVNDLINQATDERNLAVLYSGWAAYV